jgi:hypothetical protein
VNKPKPDLSPLLPDDATLKARRSALVDAVGTSKAPTVSPAWRRGPRLALGGAVVAVAVAAALVVSAGGDNPPAAFAVEPQDGGGVTITIYSLEDATGLEAALEDAGIRSQVTWLPAETICREPHYTPSTVRLPGGGSIGGMSMGGPEPPTFSVGSTRQSRKRFGEYMRGEISSEEFRKSAANLNLDPVAFRPDQSLVISGSPAPYKGDPEGGSITNFGIAEGPVRPCEPVPAPPSGNNPFGHPNAGGGPGFVPRGDQALDQAAIAADLHQTAAAAKAADTQVDGPPGPGQFLYSKTIEVHLEAWDPDGPGSGSRTKPRYFTDRQLGSEDAMPALVPTLKEVWTAPDGTTRERETLDRVEFLLEDDQQRWEEAGSPPPFAYDPDEHAVNSDGAGRPVKDYESRTFRGRREFAYMSKLAQLPTEPEALRLEIENRHGGGSPVDPSPANTLRGGATIETLLRILGEPIARPRLRAAAFDALAEIPGIGFERSVTDVAGRQGDAISWVRGLGYGRRYIFDPRTGALLAEAEMIFNAKAAGYPGVPAGTVFRETAYLQSGIVDSTHETAANASGGPVARASR